MSGIKDLDAVAANNTSAPPDGAPEGMTAASVNNIQRQQMANMKNDVVYRVPLLVDLKALNSLKQITGNGITLSGLTVVGEGGGRFYYDSASSVTADDNFVVEPTDTLGRWLRDDGDSTSKPMFLATNTVAQNNGTGGGEAITVEFDSVIYDQNGDFNTTTDTLTFPVTDKYGLGCQVFLTGILSTHTTATLELITSNRSYNLFKGNLANLRDGTSNQATLSGYTECDGDAADTAFVRIQVSNGTTVVDIASDVSFMVTKFYGHKL